MIIEKLSCRCVNFIARISLLRGRLIKRGCARRGKAGRGKNEVPNGNNKLPPPRRNPPSPASASRGRGHGVLHVFRLINIRENPFNWVIKRPGGHLNGARDAAGFPGIPPCDRGIEPPPHARVVISLMQITRARIVRGLPRIYDSPRGPKKTPRAGQLIRHRP